MKNSFFRTLCIVALSFALTSCLTTLILTEAATADPTPPVKTVYTTTVTSPTQKQTTVTTVTVTNYNTDLCFYLDLNAVAAAFAESRSVKEFEQILNSSRYMINNLDLNRDGWIDYLRVIETRSGYYHALLIQACLAPGVFQDVATLVAERRADVLYVEVIGDSYLYGYNYIVRPVFIQRPPMWNVYGQSSYTVWASPYYYGYYPSYYTQPRPIFLNHYQAYVTTYMTNHHYCHHCDYPSTPYYSGYTTMTQPHHRNDYYSAHPDQSFDNRVTRTISASNTNGVSVRNAGQLRSAVAKENNSNSSNNGSVSTRSSSTSATTTTSPSKTTSTSTSGSTRSTSTTSATQTSTSGSTRSTSTTNTQATGTSGSTRSTSTKPATTKAPSTTIETRVKSSGTTRTTIKTTDSTGRTTTIKRESSNNTSTRSGNTSTRSGNTSTRKSESSTRSSGTSTRKDDSTKSSRGSSTESNPRSGQRGR